MVLSRVPTTEQEKQFTLTLELYRAVFMEEPNLFFWGRTEDRFNYDEVYSYKYVNLWNLMSRVSRGENLEINTLGEEKKNKGKRRDSKTQKDLYIREKSI